jgi:hypothetical protein
MFFIINIDARSQQLLYNTGRTALIVHNVQGVVLSFDFACVSVFVDALCFHHIQSCLFISTYFYCGSDITFVNSNHMYTVLPVLYSSCWDLASIFMMKNINKSAVPLLYNYIVFHGLWLVYIYPIFILFSNKCNKTMPCMHCMYKEQLLVAVIISLLFM